VTVPEATSAVQTVSAPRNTIGTGETFPSTGGMRLLAMPRIGARSSGSRMR